LSIAETEHSARIVEGEFLLLPETARVHYEWRRLVVAHSVSGVQVHDAHLVAAMVVHGIQDILTFNDRVAAVSVGVQVHDTLACEAFSS
jgi:predicted nucleic acid-binding protein